MCWESAFLTTILTCIRVCVWSKMVFNFYFSCSIFLVLPSIFAGPWQVMLKQTDNSYACVAESATRFTLGEVSTIFLYLNPHWSSLLSRLSVVLLYMFDGYCQNLILSCICRPRKNCWGSWDFKRNKEAHLNSCVEATRSALPLCIEEFDYL